MELWINIVFAWIALILSFFLIVIWALRLTCKKKKPLLLHKINRKLRKHHKLIGILLIGTAFVHGLFSSDDLLSLNWGTANWIVSILLGFSWLLRKKLNMKKTWMTVHRVLTVSFVALIAIHVLNVGGFIIDDMIAGDIAPPPVAIAQAESTDNSEADEETPEPSVERTPAPTTQSEAQTAKPSTVAEPSTENTPAPATTSESSTMYQDGVYQGTGTGYKPGLVVEVTIENDIIVSVTVIDHNEKNEMFWGVPVTEIPKAIVESQSTDVDVVSGATMTSRGIIEAVEDALGKALY